MNERKVLTFVLLVSLGLLITLALSLSSSTTAHATIITVNSTADVAADDDQCTLREAIVSANMDTPSGGTPNECDAGVGDDTIDLTGISGTIDLTGPLPDLSSNIVLNGPGMSDLTVRHGAAGVYRIFTIDAGATVTISGLTISDGYTAFGPGAGIYDDELVLLLGGIERYSYLFATVGSPQPAIVELPRAFLETLVGQTVTIEYRDVYGVVVEASEMWLIWVP